MSTSDKDSTESLDVDVVLFTGVPALEPGEVELQSFKERLFGRKLEDVQADWARVSSQVSNMVDATAAERPKGFELETVEVSLGFTASGKLAFIAEAGVEASVAVTLKRVEKKPPAGGP
jgi:hypothetical protein